MTKNQTNRLKIIFKVLKKRIRPWQLIFVILLLAANTYAWFIYTTEVSNSIDVHVRAWNIRFTDKNEQSVGYMSFNVDNLYPGMEDYSSYISIFSDSEVTSEITYKLLEANIFGTQYQTKEYKEINNLTLTGDEMTSNELEQKLLTEYPFVISFDLPVNTISGQETTRYTFTASWAYESGDDAADTYWGAKAYEFKNNHSGESCITINAVVIVTQQNDSSSGTGE